MPGKIRTIIADDEALARERLRTFLQADPDIEVVVECGDGKQTVAAIVEHAPDLVFLDIQMPELNGFEVLMEVGPGRLPAVIFVTAYDRFALKAFEVHAVDYLLKPFDRRRFQKALQHAKDRIARHESSQLHQQMRDFLRDFKSDTKSIDRLAIKSAGRITFVEVDEVDWIEAADNYVNIHAGPATYMTRETLGSIESQLAGRNFLRISRSCIVNIDRVKELQPMFHGEYSVILKNGTRLTLSRGYRGNCGQLLGKSTHE